MMKFIRVQTLLVIFMDPLVEKTVMIGSETLLEGPIQYWMIDKLLSRVFD